MNKYFLFSIFIAVLLSGCGKAQPSKAIEEKTIKVQTGTLQKHDFREIFRAQGMVEAARKGTISSFVSGKIDRIYFEEGSIAEPGKMLFQIDLANLTNRLELARKDLDAARASRLSTMQGVKLAQIRLRKAELDFKRNQTLHNSKAVSADAYEQAETAFHSAKALLDGAAAIDTAAESKVQQALTGLKLAKQALEDSHPSVPFRALILKKLKEESEFAGPGTPILVVEDPASREICCRVSAVYWERMKPGTAVDVFFGGKKLCRSTIYFRAEMIEPASRTFEIKAKLPADTPLKSGTLCELEFILAERTGWGISTDAILPGRGGTMSVFLVKDGKAKAQKVSCGISSDGITEILSADALKGKQVVVSGQYFVSEGDKLEVVR